MKAKKAVAPTVPIELWRELYKEASVYRDAQPWTKVEEDQIFGFVDPCTQEKFFCCVLGNRGEFLGLAIYRGQEGIESFLKLKFAEVDQEDLDNYHVQNALVVEFTNDKEGVEKEDIAIMKSLKLSTKGPFMRFRSHLPGFRGWFLTEEDVLSFTFGLQCSLHHITHNLEAFSHLRITSLRCPLYTLQKEIQSRLWEVKECIITRQPHKKMPPVTVNPRQIDSLKAHKLCHDSSWEVSLTNTTSSLWDHERPYFAKVVMIVHQESCFVLHGEVLPLGKDIAEFFCEQIISTIQKHKRLPAELIFNDKNLQEALIPFTKSLGIQSTFSKVLPATAPVKESLLEKM